MKIKEGVGVIVNYQVANIEGTVAKDYRFDIDETIKCIETMKQLDCDVAFRNEDDLEDFIFGVQDEKDRQCIAAKVYGIEDYTVYLGSKVSLFCIDVYLKEKY